MAITADVALAETLPLDDLYGSAPVSKRRMRRSLILYVVLFIVGLSPVLLDAAAPWQAFGLGLLFPGGGFLAVGGWAYVLFPLALVLMLVACALMLLTANAFAPLLIWLGSAALVGALVPSELAPFSVNVVPLLSLGFIGWVIDKHRRLARAELARRAVRNAYLPRAEQAVLARATPRPAAGSRELSAQDLAHLHFALDRGLQPKDSFGGFHVIEQFQTSSLRYQINNLLWALQLAQCHYTPNFHGYLSQAQRNLMAAGRIAPSLTAEARGLDRCDRGRDRRRGHLGALVDRARWCTERRCRIPSPCVGTGSRPSSRPVESIDPLQSTTTHRSHDERARTYRYPRRPL